MESSAFQNTMRWINCYSLGSKSGQHWMWLPSSSVAVAWPESPLLCMLPPSAMIGKLEIVARKHSSAPILCPDHLMFLWGLSAGVMVNYCRGHMYPPYAWVETSAKVILGKAFHVLSFSGRKNFFLPSKLLFSLPCVIISFAGESLFAGNYVIAYESFLLLVSMTSYVFSCASANFSVWINQIGI